MLSDRTIDTRERKSTGRHEADEERDSKVMGKRICQRDCSGSGKEIMLERHRQWSAEIMGSDGSGVSRSFHG